MVSKKTVPVTRRQGLQILASSSAVVALGAKPSWAASRQTQQQLWVANAYGDDVHVFEVGTWKQLRNFTVGPNPHGLTATEDGRTIHISTEDFEGGAGELLWLDSKTAEVTGRLTLGVRPNAHDCTADGKWIYVPCRVGGFWWVVDGEKKEIVTKIRTGGAPHNTLVSPDGKSRMYLSMQGAPAKVVIVDIEAGHKVLGEIPFGDVPRPSAISPDEKYFFQHINGLLGFEVADIASRKVIKRIRHRPILNPTVNDERSHGLCVHPAGKEIWSSIMSDQTVIIHSISEKGFPELAKIKMPSTVYWIRFNPDGKYAYVSCPPSQVAVVDCQTRKVVQVLECGKKPKRTLVVNVPLV